MTEAEKSADVQGVAVDRLVMRLRLIAAWHTPGGPTPAERNPDKASTCTDAAEALELAQATIRLLYGKHRAGWIDMPEEDVERCRKFLGA